MDKAAWRADIKRGCVFSEVTLGFCWITSVNRADSLLAHATALEIVRELLERTGAGPLYDEGKLRDALAVHKNALSLAQFKRFLSVALHDAALTGAIRLEPSLIAGTALEEDLVRWSDIVARFFEVSEGGSRKGGHRRAKSISSSPHSGLKKGQPVAAPDAHKAKKGTVLRALKKAMPEVGKFEYLLEDSKGVLYRLPGDAITEVDYGSVSAKTLAAFDKLDEARGVPVINLEQDPMGLKLPTAVLGVDVPTCVARSPHVVGNVPTFLRQVVAYIDDHIIEEGLYRIPGGAKRINELCYLANQGRPLHLDVGDVEACCSVVVRWLRTLPDKCGLLWNASTQAYRSQLSAAAGNLEERKRLFRAAVGALAPENNATLRFLTRHFRRVGAADNKMTLANLDICIPGGLDIPALVSFGCTLWPDFDDPDEELGRAGDRVQRHYLTINPGNATSPRASLAVPRAAMSPPTSPPDSPHVAAPAVASTAPVTAASATAPSPPTVLPPLVPAAAAPAALSTSGQPPAAHLAPPASSSRSGSPRHNRPVEVDGEEDSSFSAELRQHISPSGSKNPSPKPSPAPSPRPGQGSSPRPRGPPPPAPGTPAPLEAPSLPADSPLWNNL